jgi:uncharacterized membrane protein
MIAEIENKGKWQSINSEDELTGNLFGNLRYLSFNKGLKYIFKSCIGSHSFKEALDSINAEEWADNIDFWRREKEGEPDVLLKFNNAMVLIEVKYNSDLSSPNQLDKYQKLLSNIAGEREKIMILLAREGDARSIYDKFVGTRTSDSVHFGYLTWQKVLEALNDISNLSSFESVIVNDLKRLLAKKGFGGFRNFNISHGMVDKTELWTFDCEDVVTDEFSFIIDKSVDRSLYYEFR